jgi:hypothetical protein
VESDSVRIYKWNGAAGPMYSRLIIVYANTYSIHITYEGNMSICDDNSSNYGLHNTDNWTKIE